ncbi:transcriptional repressor NrdR [Candidatus Saccharibacteria bacterium]|nr:transcriptional repressor NrdR [Candidatus Saccharibacteria bacterium]MBQ3271144.1 transcriptional repressor NrdR [Candidatus Saccharibacteria bacterium]MBR0415955.1 transcriptional repressor NrdR [Candidatus Saccharibacteria bacterium]
MGIKIKIGDSKVLESREAMDGTMIRRRRVSSDGKIRFTTYERIEMPTIMVRKRSGNREEFDRDKLITSVRRSVGKFFNSSLEVEKVVDEVMDRIYDLGVEEVTSRQIGELTLDVLAEVNEVAYVRFASVFQEFRSLAEFEQIIKEQKQKKEGKK